jgi:multidrug transporter EmrE-like cation transporter
VIKTLLFAAYTAMSVTGLILLKIGSPALSRALAGQVGWVPLLQLGTGALLYIGAFAVWVVILSRIELSIAYPVAVGLTLVFLSIGSTLVLNEAIATVRLLGIALIFAGITLVVQAW